MPGRSSRVRSSLLRAGGGALSLVSRHFSGPGGQQLLPALGMGLVHTRAGPGGAIARSGGKVVILRHPLFVLPASAILLDLSISLLGYEALVCWICVSVARVDMFVIVAPDPSCESPS